ncbi:MAG: DUF2890 domain-containing protein [Akkermansiaceae bacterium]|nr:DUF2890 domain-containing protein [Akkermansiaceae bacterium]
MQQNTSVGVSCSRAANKVAASHAVPQTSAGAAGSMVSTAAPQARQASASTRPKKPWPTTHTRCADCMLMSGVAK